MKYERFQILSSARQELFSPDSPAWVSRVQLSLDLESGKRLLQTRLVNCSEKQIRQVFLRVICLGARRERLAQLELVPMPGLAAGPGRVFGDDKPVEIPVKGTVFAEVFAQRVRFADGSAWLDFWDFIVSTNCLPVGALIFALFCSWKFGWGWDNFVAEANAGKGLKVQNWMKPIFQYFVPICVAALYIYGLVTFGWK